MNVVVFSHSAQGVLMVCTEDLLTKSDQELGQLVLGHIKRFHPQLVKDLELEGYEEVFVVRQDGDVWVEIMGDNGILYVDMGQHLVLGVQEPVHKMAEAMLAAI